MTARSERAVRAGPGLASDRRGTVGMDGGDDGGSTVANRSKLPDYVTYEPRQILHELGQCRDSLSVWLFLYWEKAGNVYQMRRQLKPGQQSIERSLRTLTRLGLVDCRPLGRFPFAKVYFLTDRGRKLAETPIPSWPTIVVD